jgi:sugar phosphate isomerase/epimerase
VPEAFPSPHDPPLSTFFGSASSWFGRTQPSPERRDSQRENLFVRSLLAVNEITTYRWSFLEDVLGYMEAGIRTMGVWRPKLDEFGEERAVDIIRETKMAVSSVSYAGCFTGQNGYAYEESLSDAKDALRVAGALKADCVVMLSGGLSGHIYTHARRLFVSALTELGDLAGEQGVKLAVQPMCRLFANDRTFITSIDETLDVIDACDHDRVGMAFDVYHLWQEPRLLERIAEIAPLVATVQLNDWHRPPLSEYDRGLIGEGEIPLGDITHAFLDNGYRGPFEISIWSEELWKTNYDWLLQDCRSRFENLLAPCPS